MSFGKQRSKARCDRYPAVDETALFKMHPVLIFRHAQGSMSELSVGEAIILSTAHLMLVSGSEPHRNILLKAQGTFGTSAAMNVMHEHPLASLGAFKNRNVSLFCEISVLLKGIGDAT